MFKKIGIIIMSLVLFVTFSTSGLAQASGNDNQPTAKEVMNSEILIDAINELDQKLDMENLSNNSKNEINELSKDAKELYNYILNYDNQKSTSLTGEDALSIFNNYIMENDGIDKNANSGIQPTGVINYKKYKISNAKINELVKLAGLNGGFWATATAIAKVFGKNPTALTLMIAAVPMLGIAGLNLCNSKGKGIVITKAGSGAVNTYSCTSQ